MAQNDLNKEATLKAARILLENGFSVSEIKVLLVSESELKLKFATAALTGLASDLQSSSSYDYKEIAKSANELANAMVAEWYGVAEGPKSVADALLAQKLQQSS